MLTDLLLLIIDAVTGFFTAILLARFYMQWARVSFRNQLGQFVIQLTDWVVVPARRVVPSAGGLDLATLVVAWLLQALLAWVIFALRGQAAMLGFSVFAASLGIGFFEVLRLSVWFLIVVVLVGAVMSWVAPYHPIAGVLNSISRPFLRPFQRIVPTVANIDLSPLVLLLVLQIVLYLLARLQAGVVPALAM